ncbi:hypothetical protein TNIN_129911 [Trichonephila inaurata madagascariensis]|uniref:Uncharacterized protein n=1 Tax=Trichonephila inaurata madagascariensis TaxID=2747483 RepID=A0A8X6Y586_9ARAC|nr:hypothetical protein TNIN_129911 [Trichonephila inaurata madagascariensis]
MDISKKLIQGCLLYDFKMGYQPCIVPMQTWDRRQCFARFGYSVGDLPLDKAQKDGACSTSIFNRGLTSDEMWVLYDTPKRSKHWLPRDPVPPFGKPLILQKIMLMLCTRKAQTSLWTDEKFERNRHVKGTSTD